MCPLLGVCRLLSSVMSGTESHADREEDYRFLHSMLMEKKLHLLFKVEMKQLLFNEMLVYLFDAKKKGGVE